MISNARTIKIQELVRRLKASTTNPGCRYAYFLGAGCSVSSGIPGAATLVKSWMPRLKELRRGQDYSFEMWLKEDFPNYKENLAALYYGEVIESLFLTSKEQQTEIERLVDRKDPGFGYAVLAQMMSNPTYGQHFNIVLTTNFDDMVPDALYLYTNKKPLVVAHESLAGFIRIADFRPLVVKLHGDARLAPKNTKIETERLNNEVKEVIKNLLAETGLIFVGYGGNDVSIVSLLEELPEDAFPWGIYWVHNKLPNGKLAYWLQKRKAVWVEHLDFDEFMVLLWSEFQLKHPQTKERFEGLVNRYFDSFTELKKKIEGHPESTERRALEQAVERAASEFKDWQSVVLEAEKYKKTEPEKSNKIYQEGLKKFPNAGPLLMSYAEFLTLARNFDEADRYYELATKTEVAHFDLFLMNYARFLEDVRQDYVKADEYYLKAIEANPNQILHLREYALFLKDVKHDYVQAKEYFKLALDADPTHTETLRRYARFLDRTLKSLDAEQYYERAIKINPRDAKSLAYYAIFLEHRKEDWAKAEEYYKKALAEGGNSPRIWCQYANFLHKMRKDSAADELYQAAIRETPQDPNNLTQYAGFLFALGNLPKGRDTLMEALKFVDTDPLRLECRFYRYAHVETRSVLKNSLGKISELIGSGVRLRERDLFENVERAIQDGHPQPELLKVLASVISDETSADELEKHDDWKKAKSLRQQST